MQEKLVIYLNNTHPDHPDWAVVDALQNISQSDGQDLAQLAEGKEVVIIVPAEDVVLTAAKLPKLNNTRLQQALPYALEEQLVDDVENLHFASSVYDTTNGDVPVAIVAREKMQLWLDQLKTWGVTPDVMIPMTLALPVEEHVWHIAVREMAVVRINTLQGFACDPAELSAWLLSALATHAKPTSVHLHYYTNDKSIQAIKLPIPGKAESADPEQLIRDLASWAITPSPINLLQGQFAIKKKKKKIRLDKIGKRLSYVAIAWLTLIILYPLGSYIILKQRTNDLQNQMWAIYQHSFPDATSMVAPQMRMEERLHKLMKQSSDNRLLLMLGYISKGLTASSNVTLKRLEYQGTQVSLNVSVPNPDDYSAFTDQLKQQGLTVKQQHAAIEGASVNATLEVE